MLDDIARGITLFRGKEKVFLSFEKPVSKARGVRSEAREAPIHGNQLGFVPGHKDPSVFC